MKEQLQDHIWTPSGNDSARELKFIRSEFEKLDEKNIGQLIDAAVEYRKNAYTPYSHYNVGASILTTDGEIFGGCNSESVAFSPTNHAEGTAIAKAVSEGAARVGRKFMTAFKKTVSVSSQMN